MTERAEPPRIAILILAAGCSRRMKGGFKLLMAVDGVPMVRRVAEAAHAASPHTLIVVTGHEAEAVRLVLSPFSPVFIHNPDYASGMASSLRCGVSALPETVEAVLVMLGDMPYLRPSHLQKLMTAYAFHAHHAHSADHTPIIVPTCHGKRGNPVLWPRCHFLQMQTLEGDQGARTLLQQFADEVVEIEMEDDAVLLDIDTAEDLVFPHAESGMNQCFPRPVRDVPA